MQDLYLSYMLKCVSVYMCVQFRMEPGQVVQETFTVEEDPQESLPVISVETSDDGTTRRTETTVAWADGKWIFNFIYNLILKCAIYSAKLIQ